MLQRKQSILIHASGHFGQVFLQDILSETIGFYDIPVKISAGLDGPPETVFSVNGCQTDALSEIPVRIHPVAAGLNLLRKNHFINHCIHHNDRSESRQESSAFDLHNSRILQLRLFLFPDIPYDPNSNGQQCDEIGDHVGIRNGSGWSRSAREIRRES